MSKITGTGLSGATAIEIGTGAQFTAGTPTTLVLCASSGPGCFTVTNSTTLDISAMPGHVAGAVTVQVVTLGTSASTAYLTIVSYREHRPGHLHPGSGDPAQHRPPARRQRHQRHRQHHRHLESLITVTVPPSAIVGLYTATITHSVS